MGTGALLNAAGIGIGATLLLKFLAAETWTLINTDDNEALQGQFPTEDNSWDVSANYGEASSLGRQYPILQFLNGSTDRVSLKSRFRKMHEFDDSITDKVKKLVSWCRRDRQLGRPPILQFAIGDGEALNLQVVLTAVSGIKFSNPSFTGSIREATFTINLLRFKEFSLDDEEETDTRYHRTAEGETYELIAKREYGNPMLGDVIRKQSEQTGKGLLVPGDVVKLPSIEGVRDTVVTQTSVPLKTAYGKKDTAQRANRVAHFEMRNVPGHIFTHDRPVPTPASVAGPAAPTNPFIFLVGQNSSGIGYLGIIKPMHGERSIEIIDPVGSSGSSMGWAAAYDPGVRSGKKQLWWTEYGNKDRKRIWSFDMDTKWTHLPGLWTETSTYPWGICFDGDGYIWVATPNLSIGSLRKYDPLNLDAPLWTSPDNHTGYADIVTYDAEENRIYCVGQGWNYLTAYIPDTGELDWEIYLYEIASCNPCRWGTQRKLLMASASLGNLLNVIDIDTHTVIDTFTVPNCQGIAGIAYDPTRDLFWISSEFDPAIFCIDMNTKTVISEIPLSTPYYRPYTILYEPASSGDFGTSGDRVWCAMRRLGGSDGVSIIDPANPTVIEEDIIFTDRKITKERFGLVYVPATEALPDPVVSNDGEALIQPETWFRAYETAEMAPFIAAHYRAGEHNIINVDGRVDEFVDLSTHGRNATPYAGNPSLRPEHIASVAEANGQPAFRFTGTEHMVSTATLQDLITVACPYSGTRNGRTEFTWYVVFRNHAYPTEKRCVIACMPLSGTTGTGVFVEDGTVDRYYTSCLFEGGYSYDYHSIVGGTPVEGLCLHCTSYNETGGMLSDYEAALTWTGGTLGPQTYSQNLTRPLEIGNSAGDYLNGFIGDIFEIFLVRRELLTTNIDGFFNRYTRQTYGYSAS